MKLCESFPESPEAWLVPSFWYQCICCLYLLFNAGYVDASWKVNFYFLRTQGAYHTKLWGWKAVHVYPRSLESPYSDASSLDRVFVVFQFECSLLRSRACTQPIMCEFRFVTSYPLWPMNTRPFAMGFSGRVECICWPSMELTQWDRKYKMILRCVCRLQHPCEKPRFSSSPCGRGITHGHVFYPTCII